MEACPYDVWHIIDQKLNLVDIFRFSSSYRPAKIRFGKAEAVWNSIFMDYAWIDDVKLRGRIPILMFIDGEMPHVYLHLIQRENKTSDEDSDSQPEQDMAILNKIKASLQPSNCGRNEFEAQFENFTLDMSNVLFHGMHICQHLFQMSSKKNLIVAIYGESLENFNLKVFGNQIAVMEFEGFKKSTFANNTIENNPWSLIIGTYRVLELQRSRNRYK
jgi:hypothetical protein